MYLDDRQVDLLLGGASADAHARAVAKVQHRVGLHGLQALLLPLEALRVELQRVAEEAFCLSEIRSAEVDLCLFKSAKAG